MDKAEQQVAEILANRGNGKKHAGGRPPKVPKVDGEAIGHLASIHCTMEEIAVISGLSVDTLERRYADTIEKGRADGKASLRRQQYLTAIDPRDPAHGTMLVWLGKVLLGQREHVEFSGRVEHVEYDDETLIREAEAILKRASHSAGVGGER